MKKKKQKVQPFKNDLSPIVLGQADLSEGCDHPYFKEKTERMNKLIRKYGLPKEWTK